MIEKQRLATIGPNLFLGIIGDANHSFGFHLCSPPAGDYSLDGAANKPVCDCACAIDIGMDWPASRKWLAWLITEISEDRITGIAEVIGSLDGSNVRYWSDDSGWHQQGEPYQGEGHDTWTHVSVYRSTAKQDHKILAGWTADGYRGENVATGDDDFIPHGRSKGAAGRNVGVLAADVWGNEIGGKSPYDGVKSFRSLLLERLEANTKATLEAVLALQDAVNALKEEKA